MSHFPVLVITDSRLKNSVASILQPYHEFECTGKDDQYVQTIEVPLEVAIEEYFDEEEIEELLVTSIDDLDLTGTHKYGYILHDKDNQFHYYHRTNPNKKWDWWQLGGRWENMFVTITGQKVDYCPLEQLDLRATSELHLSVTESFKNVPNFTYYHSLVDEKGWWGNGEMGWWGINHNEVDNWETLLFNKLLELQQSEDAPYLHIFAVDCHI